MLEKHQILRSRAANNLKSGGLRFSHKPHAKNNHPNLRTHPRQPDCNHLTKKFTQRNAEGMDNSYRQISLGKEDEAADGGDDQFAQLVQGDWFDLLDGGGVFVRGAGPGLAEFTQI